MAAGCGQWSVVGTAEDDSLIVHPLYCRSWSCGRCAPRQKRRLLRRLDGADTTGLMTLTCNPAAWPHQTAAFRGMSLAVNHLVKRIRRTWPNGRFEYFIIWERTKKGWPHAHLLIRAPYIPQSWLSDTWAALTGAPVVDVRRLNDPDQVVSYVAKYLAKDPFVPAGMKRYRMSKGFLAAVHAIPPEVGARASSWRLVRDSPIAHATALSHAGYTAQSHVDGSYTLFPPWSTSKPAHDSLSFFPPTTQPLPAAALSIGQPLAHVAP